MRIQAAVTYEKGAPFKIEEVELDAPKFGEILVRIVASGICHTDEAVQHQFLCIFCRDGVKGIVGVFVRQIVCRKCQWQKQTGAIV